MQKGRNSIDIKNGSKPLLEGRGLKIEKAGWTQVKMTLGMNFQNLFSL